MANLSASFLSDTTLVRVGNGGGVKTASALTNMDSGACATSSTNTGHGGLSKTAPEPYFMPYTLDIINKPTKHGLAAALGAHTLKTPGAFPGRAPTVC
jgi:hypothetical protein